MYVDRRDRVWLLDVGPFGGDADPLLFSWRELAGGAARCGTGGGTVPDEEATEAGHGSGLEEQKLLCEHGQSARTTAAEACPVAVCPVRFVDHDRIAFRALAHHAFPDDALELGARAARAGGVEAAVASLQHVDQPEGK